MTPEETKKEINLSTVEDNLPFAFLFRYTLKNTSILTRVALIIVPVFFVVVLLFGLVILSSDWLTFAIVTFFVGGILLSMILGGSRSMKAELRATALAQANGFYFARRLFDPDYSGFLFSLGDSKKALALVTGNYKNHEFNIFNYSYMIRSGENRSEERRGVVMVKLPRRVPHVIFDSRSNNQWGVSSLGTSFARSQRFTFEGDFNKHFDVYAPENYGRDVLYFMTPELMALLVDNASSYDIEVVDDNLFFYAPEFDYKRAQLENIFKLIENVGGEFTENTSRYADERVGSKQMNLIAEPGKRLKRGISWIIILIVAAYTLQVLFGVLLGLSEV